MAGVVLCSRNDLGFVVFVISLVARVCCLGVFGVL